MLIFIFVILIKCQKIVVRNSQTMRLTTNGKINTTTNKMSKVRTWLIKGRVRTKVIFTNVVILPVESFTILTLLFTITVKNLMVESSPRILYIMVKYLRDLPRIEEDLELKKMRPRMRLKYKP